MNGYEVETPPQPASDLRPILLVDDNEDDLYFLQRRLKKGGVQNPTLVFRDGEELLQFLAQPDAGSKARPFLMLLDLKMPKVGGFDVLASVRAQETFRGLSVAVITSSPLASDHERALAAGANEVFEKFPTETELADVVDRASRHPFFEA